MRVVFSRETVEAFALVFCYAVPERAGDADMDCPAVAVGGDIDCGVPFFTHGEEVI